MVVLHLIRHGQSTWNVEGRIQGQLSEPELTDLGREQAAATAGAVAALGLARLLTSDLTRAVQTAEIIGAACHLDPIPTSLLREQDLGRLQGLTTAQAFADYPDEDYSDPDRLIGGYGESARDVHGRVAALLASPLVSEAPGPVGLVTHGDTIRWALAHLLAEDLREVPWRAIDNGSITTVVRVEDAAGDPWIQARTFAADGTVVDQGRTLAW
ncbi:histidine phosphatase family protein [Nakamurella silvestris]|nr:histidine phosphatase family protein [Nakamurella silvestris]